MRFFLSPLLIAAIFGAACSGNSPTARAEDESGGAGSQQQGGTATTGGSSGGAPVAGSSGGLNEPSGVPDGGTPMSTGMWHGAKSARVTDAVLAQEYATWKSRNTQACSDGGAVVKQDGGSVVSEGIGYGMLLAAAFADRVLFDGLFQYYQDHLDKNGLMNWKTGVCEAPGNNNQGAATDADLDTAMALLQADRAWPGQGYFAKADALAGNILSGEVVDCDGRATLRPGDAWGGCTDPNHETRINPSYYAPGYFHAFAARFPEHGERFTALARASYELYPIWQARMAGLVPDWSNYNGDDWRGASYSYDACRTPWRVAVDYGWTGDPGALAFLKGVTGWIDAHGGVPKAAQQNNSAFIGSFAISALYDQSKLDTYVGGWLSAMGDDMPYYQATLRVLYLLAAAGKFEPVF